jgi:hypothetical protein
MPHRVIPKMIAYIHVKLHKTKNYHIISKSGVNFQVTLKEICIQQDLFAFKISLSVYENWTAQLYT